VDNLKEFSTANKGNGGYKVIIGILVALLIGLGFLYYSQQQKTEKIIAELNDATEEKVELTREYEDLLVDYDDLETNNDSLSKQLDDEKLRITELIAELKSTKAQNRADIKKYKNELKTLRDIMKGFIYQIDSLNTLNTELIVENKNIKKQYHTEQRKNEKLSEKYEAAADKVKIASVIKAIDVVVTPYNHKGKSTFKAKKAKRFAVNFSLDENSIAKKGTKKIYLRITDPDQHILIQDNQPVFAYEDDEIAYSSVREVEYDGSVTPAVVYFEHQDETELPKGSYNVDVFCDGAMIGSANVSLD